MTTQTAAKPAPDATTAPAARRLAAFAAGLRPDALDGAVWDKIEICTLDWAAACLTGRDLPWVRRALAWADALGAAPECTVVGDTRRTAAPEAAFVNAVAGHSLVREDMHVAACSHIGVVVLPAALATAERTGASGADFACAVAAGYEVMARVGRALVGPRFVQYFRPTGIVGPLGAAVATARVLGLDAERTTQAIGFAANFAGGLNEWPRAGGEEMYLHPGMAARSGMLAAFLAAEGGRASATALDGPSAMLGAYGAAQEAARALTANLDRPREILAVFHKPAPACNYVQTPVQAALDLVRRTGVRARDIAAVTVRTFPAAMHYPGCDHAGPFESLLQAKMSLQFCVAATLVHGTLDAAAFEALDDPEVLRLARETTLVADLAFEAAYPGRQGAEIVVHTRDGRVPSERRDDLVPLSAEDVRRRFRAEAGAALPPGRAEAIEAAVAGLRDAPDMRALAGLLGATALTGEG